MKTCANTRRIVFAKTQSDLRAKIGVRKIDVHVFAMSHSCQLNIKHEFQAKHRGQRADVKWRYQFSACRVKRDNSGFSKNLSRNSKPTFGRPAAGLRPAGRSSFHGAQPEAGRRPAEGRLAVTTQISEKVRIIAFHSAGGNLVTPLDVCPLYPWLC